MNEVRIANIFKNIISRETFGLDVLRLVLCVILSFIYVTGIALFHRHEGFFVVGPGTGGWEYSALLITCLLVTAWENRERGLR